MIDSPHATCISSIDSRDPWALGQTDWNKPFPPHKIAGNVYFVGSSELASFLITTPQGNILINSDFEATVPVIRAAIEKLGLTFSDTMILLGNHARTAASTAWRTNTSCSTRAAPRIRSSARTPWEPM